MSSVELTRYSLVGSVMPREFLLLQGRGCRWRKCAFCDYHNDVSEEPFKVNKEVLEQVTGAYGVLDIINSGSAMELDDQTKSLIRQVVHEKKIHTVWFEAHYMYRNSLSEFAAVFAPAKVKFRCGVESFDPSLRKLWNKGIPMEVTPEEIAKYFNGVCLLSCTTSHSRNQIVRDIEIANSLFEYFSVNLFCNNGTAVRRDENLVRWFLAELYPELKSNPKAEVLLNNTDLGVG
ncbi:MAG: hypothetical protein IJB58_05410 [Bacteroidales bacterium]|nr:hypothetical protein [Bacteroidales bacterium]